MKTVLHIMLLYAAVLASGCSKDSGGTGPGPSVPDAPPAPPSPVAELVEIKIAPTAPEPGFGSGACVGLYVVDRAGSASGSLATSGNHVSNMRFTFNGTSWVPDVPVYWTDEATHADFYLYYPYTAVQSVTAQPFAVRADQSSEADYKASDFMVGNAADVVPSASATAIPMRHLMSRVIINIEPGFGFTATSLAAAEVSVRLNGVRTACTVDLAGGEVTPAGDATTLIPLRESNICKALLVPQTVASGSIITVSVDGRDFDFQDGYTFRSGDSHEFTVVLERTSGGINVDLSPWDDDGTDHGGTAE